jgi:hypothetical protein
LIQKKPNVFAAAMPARKPERTQMKTKTWLASWGVVLLIAGTMGCSKQGGSSGTESAPGSQTNESSLDQATAAVTNAAAAMSDTVNAAKAKVDGLIAQAKSFIADKKYDDAVAALDKLSGMTLTPDQQKVVDDLKAQLKKLMASGADAVDAAKNLMGK